MPRPRMLKNVRAVSVALDDDLYQAAKTAAESLGVSLSQLVREALAQYIDKIDVRQGAEAVFGTPTAAGKASPQSGKLNDLKAKFDEALSILREVYGYKEGDKVPMHVMSNVLRLLGVKRTAISAVYEIYGKLGLIEVTYSEIRNGLTGRVDKVADGVVLLPNAKRQGAAN